MRFSTRSAVGNDVPAPRNHRARRSFLRWAIAVPFAVGMAVHVAPVAHAASDLYKGKTVNYMVGSKPGGGYDSYARLVAPFLEKHLPGSTVVVLNRPGGSGVAALKSLEGQQANGETIVLFNTGVLLGRLAAPERIDVDVRALDFVGKAAAEARYIVVRPELGIASFAELRAASTETTFAIQSFWSASSMQLRLLIDAFDLPARAISGFGGSESEAALAKDEIDGLLTSESNLQRIIDAGWAVPLVRFGQAEDPRFAAVPDGMDDAVTEEQQLVVRRIEIMTELGRLTATAPNTSPDRLTALRDAYAAALRDPELLTQAASQQLPIAFLGGADVGRLVEEFMAPNERFEAMLKRVVAE